jgi:hypothetical protein
VSRIRTIKPEFFTSEDIVSLSMAARLLYIALWCEADREGRMAWKPATFKLRYFPGDNCDIHALCAELEARGLVAQYGDGLAYIPAFLDHQHVNPRESASKYPQPSSDAKELTRAPRVSTRANPDLHPQVGREGKGKERKGKEGINTSAVAPPPDGVSPSVWDDFQVLRKAKKSPITDTAIDGIRREADKAGMPLGEALAMCCERGWTGFKAEWVAEQKPKTSVGQVLSFAERDEAAKRRRWEEMTGRKWPTNPADFPGETIDTTTLEIAQ